MRIIPAIDLLEGKCVRLFKGDYEKVEVFHENPVEMAVDLEQEGFKYLHLVDLDGARGSGNNQQVLNAIARNTDLTVDFGGGLRTLTDISKALDHGADQVNIGSMAVKDEKGFLKCLEQYEDKVIWNADLKNGKLAIHGWQETVNNDFGDLIMKFSDNGLRNILTTDISKDGTLLGPNFALYEDLIQLYPQIGWIASGGVTSAGDVRKLKQDGLYGVVIGKALYKGTVTYKELIQIQNAD